MGLYQADFSTGYSYKEFGGWALAQLWLFWVAPIIGALLAGWLYRYFAED